jgi:hypothetical protein
MLGNYRVAAELVASRAVLSCIELVRCVRVPVAVRAPQVRLLSSSPYVLVLFFSFLCNWFGSFDVTPFVTFALHFISDVSVLPDCFAPPWCNALESHP